MENIGVHPSITVTINKSLLKQEDHKWLDGHYYGTFGVGASKKSQNDQFTRYQIPVLPAAHLVNHRSNDRQIQAMLDFNKVKDINPFQMICNTFVHCDITSKFILTNKIENIYLFVRYNWKLYCYLCKFYTLNRDLILKMQQAVRCFVFEDATRIAELDGTGINDNENNNNNNVNNDNEEVKNGIYHLNNDPSIEFYVYNDRRWYKFQAFDKIALPEIKCDWFRLGRPIVDKRVYRKNKRKSRYVYV